MEKYINTRRYMGSIKVCLATICIGEKCTEEYERLFKSSQKAYAERHGYDFFVISDYISNVRDPKVINMNKWLVCKYPVIQDREYDYVVFVDADILIRHDAPPIHESMDFQGKIGVVHQSQPTIEARHSVQRDRGFEVTAREYYQKHAGLDIESDHIINSGCLVFQPRHHAEYLERMVETFQERILQQTPGLHKDQPFFGYQLQMDNTFVYMDMKWNALWANNHHYATQIVGKTLSLQDFYDEHCFIHFAGHSGYDLIPNLKM